MRTHTRRALVAVVVSLVGAGAFAQDAPAKGAVDWENKVIRVTGAGAPDIKAPNIAVARLGAERAAKLDALRNILETLKGVQVTNGSTAGGIIESDSAVKAKVDGVLRRFKVVDTRYFSDGGVEVDVEMPLDGELASALMPPVEPKAAPSSGEATHTGLIVDVRGQKLEPALAPRIVDESGKEVYGAAYVKPEAVKSNGVAAYQRSMADAKKSDRAGGKPMVLKALRVDGSDVVITNADAASMRSSRDLAFLADGKVLFVID